MNEPVVSSQSSGEVCKGDRIPIDSSRFFFNLYCLLNEIKILSLRHVLVKFECTMTKGKILKFSIDKQSIGSPIKDQESDLLLAVLDTG